MRRLGSTSQLRRTLLFMSDSVAGALPRQDTCNRLSHSYKGQLPLRFSGMSSFLLLVARSAR